MEKRNLAKLALAALVVASSLPSGVQAHHEETKSEGILLAAGCAGHGCGAKRNEISDNTSTSNSSNPYNANVNSYQTSGTKNSGYGTTGSSNYGTGTTGTSSNYGTGTTGTSSNYGTGTTGTSSNYGTGGYGSTSTGRSGAYGSSDWNTDANRGTSSNWNTDANRGTGSNWNTDANRGTSTNWNTDANRGASTNWNANRSYGTSDASTIEGTTSRYTDTSTTPGYGATTITISDEEFKAQLSPESRRVFETLDDNGKKIAKVLGMNKDKNMAVKEALMQMQKRPNSSSTSTMYGQ